jgi:hypothetical protein
MANRLEAEIVAFGTIESPAGTADYFGVAVSGTSDRAVADVVVRDVNTVLQDMTGADTTESTFIGRCAGSDKPSHDFRWMSSYNPNTKVQGGWKAPKV